MDGEDEDLAAAMAIEDGIRSAGDDELADIGFGGGMAEFGLKA